jgi:hypothetical protein
MREYRDVEIRVVTRTECVKVQCDMCGRSAEDPNSPLPFRWGGVGSSGGSLEYAYSIDGEHEPEKLDLCYECADKVADFIRSERRK